MDARNQGPGIYFDGETGAPHSVTLTLEDSAIAIASAEGAPLARWDYPAIEHLPAARDRARLGLAASPSTARLEVRDPAFAQAVKGRLGFGTPQEETNERRRRHRVVQWSIAAIAAVIIIGVAGVPAFSELLLPFIPRSAEVRVGLEAHEEVKKNFDSKAGPFECGDAGEMERASKAVFLQMFRRLEAAAGLPIPLHPFVIRTSDVNAVAYPGGYVHVYMGLINEVQSPDELGGIIGHEIGHVAHRDSMRSALRSAGLSYLFGMVLGDVIGSGGLIVAALRVLDNKHTRAQEAAADVFGVQVMNKLGADSHAMANVFERWMRQSQQHSAQPRREMLLMRDHPADADRVAAIRSTPAVANPKPLLTAAEWQTLKQVCSGK